jgi:hypothetical protein
MGIPINVLNFAKEHSMEDIVIAFRDMYNEYQSIEYGKRLSFDNSKSFEEKNEKLNESMIVKIREMSGINFADIAKSVVATHPSIIWASFAVIGALIDSILPDTIIGDFGRFAEVKVGGFGDSFVWTIKPSDLFVVTKSGRGKRSAFAQRQYNGNATLIPEDHVITVGEDVYRILSGKGNLAEYAAKIVKSFETEMAYDTYSAINDTYSDLPSQFREASFGEGTFVTLAERVRAFNNGVKVTAFGTKVALSSVVPSNVIYNDSLGEEYNRTGYLNSYRGIDLVEMSQKATWNSSTYALRLDDTRVYLVSSGYDKLVKVAIEGETLTFGDSNIAANANLTMANTMHKAYKVGLISNSYFGILDIS